MKIAESYSVIVIPKDRAKVKRWIVSRERILGTFGLGFCFLFFVGMVCLGLVHYRQEYLATENLRHRGKQYQKERVRVLARLSALEDVVSQNEQLAQKLETVVGINQNMGVQVGVGGSSPSASLHLASLDPAVFSNNADFFDETQLKSFDLKAIDLMEEAKDVGSRLQEVYRFNADANYFWSALPTVWPVRGWITSDFGYRRSPLSGGKQLHEGVDIASPHGSPVVATGDGIVTFASRQGGLGNKIVLDHGYGLATVYGHNSRILVQEGESVHRGQIIAMVGSTGRSTGPHLHYEVLVSGIPVDPLHYILEQL